MEKTPRWEYRCWTSRDHAQSLFAADWQASPVEQRHDIYLIGPDPAIIPKLRNATQFEIKRLLESRGQTELWAPGLSVPLPNMPERSGPLQAAGMDIFSNAAQPADFIRIAAEAEQWFAAPVEKSRQLFAVDGLRCEVTRVIFADQPYWTFAAEAPEYPPLAQLLENLPLGNLPNRNYRNFLIDRRRTKA